MPWTVENTEVAPYTCGYCGSFVATEKGLWNRADPTKRIYICPRCDRPTYIEVGRVQTPGAPHGNEVSHLPEQLGALYREARDCTGLGADTAAVLICRKILMHIAHEQGSGKKKNFKEYVEWLIAHNYVPAKREKWVHHIRDKGNFANHEIVLMDSGDSKEMIALVEMLLKLIFEFPKRISPDPDGGGDQEQK